MSTAGALKSFYDSYREGLEYFVAENPTILGRPIELVVVDDGAEPSVALSGAERLLDEDQVDVIVGPYLSGVSAAVLGPINDAGVVNFNLSAFADAGDPEVSPHTFHIEWPKAIEGRAQVGWACEQGVQSIATIVVNNPLGTETDESIQVGIADAGCGIEYVGSEQFTAGATDALAQAEEFADADMVVVGAVASTDFAAVVNSLGEIGYDGWIVGNYALGVQSALDLFDPDVVASLVPFGATPSTLRPLGDEAQRWLDGITDFLGRAPAANTYKAYDALLLLQAAADGAGSFDVEAIESWLEGNEVCGVYGCYAYTADSHDPFPPEQNVPFEPGSEVSGFFDPWS